METEYRFIPRKKRKAHPTASRLNATTVAKIISALLSTEVEIRESGTSDHATDPEKRRTIATELLLRDPPTFLERYGKHLHEQTINLFQPLSDDPEISYYLEKLSRRKVNDVTRRNRRLCFLKQSPGFMSEQNMRKRNESLWQSYLGSFPADNMKPQAAPSNNLWDLLKETRSMIRKEKGMGNGPWFQESKHIRKRTEQEKQKLEEQIRRREEEEDESEHDSDDMETMEVDVINPAQMHQAKERQAAFMQYKEEMTRLFLSGHDKNVDYKAIDENNALCDKIREQDLEDSYFDSEKW